MKLVASLKKRLFWRNHLTHAKDFISRANYLFNTPESFLAVPFLYQGKGFYRTMELKQNVEEIKNFLIFLQKTLKEIHHCCEIGTYKGGTLYLWCRMATENAKIISVDLPGGKFGGGYSDKSIPFFKAFCKENQKLTCIRGDSQNAEIIKSVWKTLDGKKLDFLFIDGDHSYEGVKNDFNNYKSFVRSGGVIAFHDIIKREDHDDIEVWKLWNELKSSYRHQEFISEGKFSRPIGIGVLINE